MEKRLKRRRGAPVIEKVLATTLEHLAARGYARLSVPEVAADAGVNKTSVYRRWATKAELVRDALGASLGAAAPLPDTGTLRGDLVAMASAAVAFAETPLGRALMRTLLADADDEVRSLTSALARAPVRTAPRRLLKRAVERGELREDVDASLLLSVISGTLWHRIVVEQRPASRAFIERLVDLLLEGGSRRKTRRGRRR